MRRTRRGGLSSVPVVQADQQPPKFWFSIRVQASFYAGTPDDLTLQIAITHIQDWVPSAIRLAWDFETFTTVGIRQPEYVPLSSRLFRLTDCELGQSDRHASQERLS